MIQIVERLRVLAEDRAHFGGLQDVRVADLRPGPLRAVGRLLAVGAARAGLAVAPDAAPHVRLLLRGGRADDVRDVRRLAELHVGEHGGHLDALLHADRLLGAQVLRIAAAAAARPAGVEQLVVEGEAVGDAVARRLLGRRRLGRHHPAHLVLAVALGGADAAVGVAPRGRVLLAAHRAVALVLAAARCERVLVARGRARLQLAREAVVVGAEAAVAPLGGRARAVVRAAFGVRDVAAGRRGISSCVARLGARAIDLPAGAVAVLSVTVEHHFVLRLGQIGAAGQRFVAHQFLVNALVQNIQIRVGRSRYRGLRSECGRGGGRRRRRCCSLGFRFVLKKVFAEAKDTLQPVGAENRVLALELPKRVEEENANAASRGNLVRKI